jgi:hypothetical protein
MASDGLRYKTWLLALIFTDCGMRLGSGKNGHWHLFEYADLDTHNEICFRLIMSANLHDGIGNKLGRLNDLTWKDHTYCALPPHEHRQAIFQAGLRKL